MPQLHREHSAAIGARAPAVVIRFELETKPRIYMDVLNDSEETRLADWLCSRPRYAALVHRAFELSQAA